MNTEDEKTIRRMIGYLEERLLEDEKLREVIKPKEPEFRSLQPVLIRDSDDQKWQKAHFIKYSAKDTWPYAVILLPEHREATDWKQCIPDPEATTRINWIPWEGGECPTDKPVITEDRNGIINITNNPGIHDWSHCNHDADIIAYAIIEE